MRTMKLFAAAIAVSVIAGPALASDLPTTKGPPAYLPPPPVFTWAGIYIGGQMGYQWGEATRTTYDAAGAFFENEPTIDANGFVGGAHIGYNYQIGQFVAGLEGDVDGSTYSGHGLSASGTIWAQGRIPVEGSVRGRLGVAWDRALIYATGGVAFASLHSDATLLGTPTTDTFDNTLVGWTAGGGVEYAVDHNWSVRAEYRYTDYGNVTNVLTYTTAALPGGPYSTTSHLTDNRVEVGFSYKFDMFAPPAPVVGGD